MAGFDFLSDKQQPPQPEPSASPPQDLGSGVKNGDVVFYDQYNNHLDAHALFSTPPKREEFGAKANYDRAVQSFSLDRLEYYVENRPYWYGINTSLDKLIAGYTEFADPGLLDTTIKNVTASIPDDLFSGIDKPKMKINDRFGMFSFDLASMAMTYVYEYFDKKGNKVDANYAFAKAGKFYHEKTEEEIFQKIKRRKNGTPVVVSSVRNCLIDFEKEQKEERSVEIFITSAFSSREDSEDILYNSMAGIIVAKNLISKGFKVKITAITVGQGSICKQFYYHLVPVKNFNEPLDVNAVAYVCGDARFFRYQGFKMLIWGIDQNKKKVSSGIAAPVESNRVIKQHIETKYVPYSKLKQADTRLYFGGARSLRAVEREIEQSLELLNEKYGNDEN